MCVCACVRACVCACVRACVPVPPPSARPARRASLRSASGRGRRGTRRDRGRLAAAAAEGGVRAR
eukprot:4664049-Pleurochrysis_carterae.AAC.1